MGAIVSLSPSSAIDKIISIDEVSSSLYYVGKAAPGTLTSEAKWQIKSLSGTPPDLDVRMAGNGEYNQIWDNRASLSYS